MRAAGDVEEEKIPGFKVSWHKRALPDSERLKSSSVQSAKRYYI